MLDRVTGHEDFETDIMQKMNDLGYNIDVKGICYGLKMLWIQAALSGQKDNLLERVKLIYKTSDLPQRIKDAQEKGRNLSTEDQQFIDILAFFDGIKLFQGQFYSDAFNRYVFQQIDFDMVASTVASKQLEKSGGMTRVFFSSISGTKADVENYLINLKGELKKLGLENANATIFSLSGEYRESLKHSTAFMYDWHADKWIFFNSNQMQRTQERFTDSEMALEMMKAYAIFPKTTNLLNFSSLGDAATKEKIALSLEIITTGEKKETIGNQFKTSTISNISSELIVKGIVSKNFNLLERSLYNNDAFLIKEALKILKEMDYKDWNIGDSNGKTIAHHIILNGSFLEDLNEITKGELDWKKPDNNGITPLHLAVGANNFEAISWLVKNIKKDWNIVDANDITPSMVAILLENISVLKLLSPHIDWHMLGPQGITHTHWAAGCGKVSSLEFLKQQGVDLDSSNKDGVTPALMAMKNGKTAAVIYLIKQNIDLNRADEHGKTLMHYAAEQHNIEILKLLASFPNVEWNKKDNSGKIPAHYAVKDPDAIEILTKINEINWNSQDNNGKTPAFLAVEHAKQLSCFDIDFDNEPSVLPQGTDSDDESSFLPQDTDIKRPLAKKSEVINMENALKLIVKNGADLDQVISLAPYDPYIEPIVDRLIAEMNINENINTSVSASSTSAIHKILQSNMLTEENTNVVPSSLLHQPYQDDQKDNEKQTNENLHNESKQTKNEKTSSSTYEPPTRYKQTQTFWKASTSEEQISDEPSPKKDPEPQKPKSSN